MLVLSRKKDECIVINNDITIVVVEIRGDKVRLGVEAPKEVPVHRREVFDAISMVGGKIGADVPTDAAAEAIDQSRDEENASPPAPQSGKSGDGPGANAVKTGGMPGQHLQGQHLQGPCELESRVDG
jgi:carbon storage regulator